VARGASDLAHQASLDSAHAIAAALDRSGPDGTCAENAAHASILLLENEYVDISLLSAALSAAPRSEADARELNMPHASKFRATKSGIWDADAQVSSSANFRQHHR
jgi:hypothetical protein